MYSLEEAEAVEASIDVLPIVVRALGIGATRYLKVPFNTFELYLQGEHMLSGIDSATHTHTPSGPSQEVTGDIAVVFSPCVGDSHTGMSSSYRELEGHNRRRCGKMLGWALG
jgi:hypothetical protein